MTRDQKAAIEGPVLDAQASLAIAGTRMLAIEDDDVADRLIGELQQAERHVERLMAAVRAVPHV